MLNKYITMYRIFDCRYVQFALSDILSVCNHLSCSVMQSELIYAYPGCHPSQVHETSKNELYPFLASLVTPDVMEELVQMITVEPGEDEDDKVKYK